MAKRLVAEGRKCSECYCGHTIASHRRDAGRCGWACTEPACPCDAFGRADLARDPLVIAKMTPEQLATLRDARRRHYAQHGIMGEDCPRCGWLAAPMGAGFIQHTVDRKGDPCCAQCLAPVLRLRADARDPT
jgi:hypothetical protein